MGRLVDFSKDLHDYNNEEEYEEPGLCYCYDCHCEFLSNNGFPMCPNCLSFDTYYCESDLEIEAIKSYIEQLDEDYNKRLKKQEEINKALLSITLWDNDDDEIDILDFDGYLYDDTIYDNDD